MDAWGSVLALAASQHQVVALRQVAELGIDPRAFRRRARREGWDEHGSTLWSPPGAVLDDWSRAMGASLVGGPHALVTGLAALRLHGLEGPAPRPIRVVVPMSRHAVRTADARHVRIVASRTITAEDATILRRVPVATVERSLVDLVLPPSPALTPVRDTVITAVQRRLTTVHAVRDRVDRARGVPGRGVLLRALADLDASGADSPFSHRVATRLRHAGLTPDPAPVPVDVGARMLHPDITYHSRRVCLECDGLRWHQTQRDLALDHRKDRAYRAAGWTCLRIGWWEYDHGWPVFVTHLREALRAA